MEQEAKVEYEVFNVSEITKPESDKRTLKYFKLQNGIKCLLIQDKDASCSAASVDAHVGSALDPRPLYGTAHFLEHWLF